MNRVSIMEVCPRDGWQSLPDLIPAREKLQYIDGMMAAGVRYMQVTSFVSPRAVPQMADAAQVARTAAERWPDRRLCALVPNLRGARDAWSCGIREVSCVVSVSESHNRANINRSHDESFAALAQIQEALPELLVVPALATAFGCPFEGEIAPQRVLELADRLVRMGFTHLELADTIGTANPVAVARLFSALKKEYPRLTLLAHLHDTRGGGILNSWVAAQNGADCIHTSLGGLGGCPFAPGASGNTCTEDFVWLLEQGGIGTGIDFEALRAVAREMRGAVAGSYSGHHIAIERDVYEEACRGEGRGQNG